VADFTQWVKMGAPDPRDGKSVAARPAYDWEKAKQFWSFKPVVEPSLPEVKEAVWSANPVDRFIRSAQVTAGVAPVEVADKRALVRRVTYDLTGLPPTPDEVEAFVNDPSPNAYSALIERLLASPAYGEKWGRHWLDVVRYADTPGATATIRSRTPIATATTSSDASTTTSRSTSSSRNRSPATCCRYTSVEDRNAKIVATGYLALARRFGSRASEFHQTVEDLIDNLGKGCSACRSTAPAATTTSSTRSRPRTTTRSTGIFNSTRYSFPGTEIYKHPSGLVALGKPEEAAKLKEFEGRLAWLDNRQEELKRELGNAMRVAKEGPPVDPSTQGPQALVLRAEMPKAEWQAVENARAEIVSLPELRPTVGVTAGVALPPNLQQIAEVDEPLPPLEDPKTALASATPMPADAPPQAERPAPPNKKQRAPRTVLEVKAETQEVEQELKRLEYQPLDIQTAFAAQEGLPQDARLHKKGDPKDLGDRVPRGFLTILGGQKLSPGNAAQVSGRLELAQWIADPSNPLTARVMVNRIWQHHFGKGIVGTPNDFGARGEAPTHPELLDYLASQFVKGGWSIKAMHRLIVSSRAYQLASVDDAKNEQLDPSDKLLWRQNPRRLSAEEIRDAMLTLANSLDTTPAGQHPFPEESTWRFTQHKPFVADYPTHHRSVYLMQQRIRKQPYLSVFDGADTNASTPQRSISTTAIQALFMMNDPLLHESADKLAVRAALAFGDDAGRIDYAYRLAYSRPATPGEIDAGRQYLSEMSAKLKASGTPWDQVYRAAWSSYARVLLGSNEFVFVD
jgi:hypothetical protein